MTDTSIEWLDRHDNSTLVIDGETKGAVAFFTLPAMTGWHWKLDRPDAQTWEPVETREAGQAALVAALDLTEARIPHVPVATVSDPEALLTEMMSRRDAARGQ